MLPNSETYTFNRFYLYKVINKGLICVCYGDWHYKYFVIEQLWKIW